MNRTLRRTALQDSSRLLMGLRQNLRPIESIRSSPSLLQIYTSCRQSSSQSSSSQPEPFGSSTLWPVARIYIVGSLVYMIFHWIWWKLESDEIEEKLSDRVANLEQELESLLEERSLARSQSTSGYVSRITSLLHKLVFW
ncbi:uncharacterized protein V1516DRAFT_664525 [Lipomyces oligophaga]|uniref:uncharacterized protein n=1 Tax=Lipomyces oligophaga TaxID=45792 RepID=UPI0034CEF2F9